MSNTIIVETGRPVRTPDCTGSTEECFRCEPGSYVWQESGELFCLSERSVGLPMVIFGGIALGAGLWLSRQSSGSIGWLGDDPAPSSSFDPSRSTKSAYQRTHIAKKFWGAAVLMSQTSESMGKLATRIRKSDPEAADDASRLAVWSLKSAKSALDMAKQYDPSWTEYRSNKAKLNIDRAFP